MNCLLIHFNLQVKEILAGDKQLAQEIEFDLRRFDQEQKEEEEELQRKAAEKDAPEVDREKGKDPAMDVDDSNAKEPEQAMSLGSSHSLPGKIVPGSATKTGSATNELHRQALLNSKALTAKRRSSIAPVPYNAEEDTYQASLKERPEGSELVTSAQTDAGSATPKISVSEKEKTSADKGTDDGANEEEEEEEEVAAEKTNTEKDDTHIDPRAIGGNSPSRKIEKTPKGKTRKKTREELLRAISTPSSQARCNKQHNIYE